jgi:hypothetical protein
MKFVRALEPHPKAVVWKFEIENFVWSQAFNCSVKTYMTGL